MGRYAQARRRGASGPTASLSSSVYIVSVQKISIDTVRIQWSNRVNTSVGVISSGVFNVAGDDAINIPGFTATTTDVQMEAAINVGDPWNLTGQPPWLISPACIPGTGIVG
jgi:hypothetical protein